MSAKVTRTERVEWMLANQTLWDRYGGMLSQRVVDRRQIVEKMKNDGVIATSTYWRDVDVEGLIAVARRLRAERASGKP